MNRKSKTKTKLLIAVWIDRSLGAQFAARCARLQVPRPVRIRQLLMEDASR